MQGGSLRHSGTPHSGGPNPYSRLVVMDSGLPRLRSAPGMTTEARPSRGTGFAAPGPACTAGLQSSLALLWQIFAADERDGIPKSVFQ